MQREQREIDLQGSLTATAGGELAQLGSADAEMQRVLAQHIESTMADLRRRAHANAGDSVVCSRAFTQLWIQGIEAGQEELRKGDASRAAAYFELMANASPDQPWPAVLLAEAWVRAGNKKGAIKALEEAVQHGLKHPEALALDPELLPLASDPAFQKMVRAPASK
jgi:predicted Zn-dependent protease